MVYQDKYTVTVAQNIILAKQHIKENIYSEMKIEGSNITFPETQTLLDGVNVASVPLDDVEKVLNLRDGWKYLLANAEAPYNLEFSNKIHSCVARNEALVVGELRIGQVGVSVGEDKYLPPAQHTIESWEKDNFDILNSSKSDTEKGIEIFINGCKQQYYWDGNKRTSNLLANKYLISKGKGLLFIPPESLLDFNIALSDFYMGKNQDIKGFLYDKGIKGVNLERTGIDAKITSADEKFARLNNEVEKESRSNELEK